MTPPPTPPNSNLPAAAVAALLVDTTPYLSCDECFDRMDTHVEAVVADPDHHDAAMDRHLVGCAACDEEAQSLIALLRM
ncbi:hypothetical protein ACOCJ4_13765 [Knoellia sp. CPCC 206435]|uniref:hypothetical protein n=1 Tax=Knoellia terrae TaxID=3404797 RepID=UPI003B42814D